MIFKPLMGCACIALLAAAESYCTQAHAEGIVAESHDSYGVELQLTDLQVPLDDDHVCLAAQSLPPSRNPDEAVPGCWSPAAGHRVRVTYLLNGATWTDDYPAEDFRLTDYGLGAKGS